VDLGKAEHRERLFKAVQFSRRKQRTFRTLRYELHKQYVGSAYGEGGCDKQTMNNLMLQTADIYTLLLAANRPQVLVNARKKELWPFATNFQIAVNNFISQIHLEKTLRRAVLDAFFGLGLVKVSRGDFVQLELDDWPIVDPGYPFAECVSLDNWVHDMTATSWDKVTFEGDTYRVPLEKVQEDERFPKDLTKDLKASTKYPAGQEGDLRVERIANGLETDPDETDPSVDLLDLYLPRTKQVATFACDGYGVWDSSRKPLFVLDWDGPEEGPYHKLSFIDVSDNTMPVSIAAQLDPLHRLSNALLRKLARQANAQKLIPFYTPGADDDARRLSDAQDRQFTKVRDKDSVGVLNMNGADPGNQAFLQALFGIFNTAAGNPSVLAGLGPQSPTATQDQMISQAAGQRVSKMQMRTAEFAAGICKHLGWHMWDDQQLQVPGQMEIPGTDISVEANWNPDHRDGDFLDYNFEVVPYSMSYQSPSEQMQAMTGAIMNVFMPLMQTPQAQQAGMAIDVQVLVEEFAMLMNLPRLPKLITFSAPLPSDGAMDQSHDRSKPPVTTRNVVRRSAPGGDSPEMRTQELMTQARQQGFNQPQLQ
jgi:hypothetical protein